MDVLWLDDDTASETITIDDVRIVKVQNCEQADRELRAHLPDWVLVDFIVPQENWGDGLLYRVPGLKFIDIVRARHKGIRVAAYGRGVLPRWRSVAYMNGAEKVYEKKTIAFRDVIRELRSLKENA